MVCDHPLRKGTERSGIEQRENQGGAGATVVLQRYPALGQHGRALPPARLVIICGLPQEWGITLGRWWLSKVDKTSKGADCQRYNKQQGDKFTLEGGPEVLHHHFHCISEYNHLSYVGESRVQAAKRVPATFSGTFSVAQ